MNNKVKTTKYFGVCKVKRPHQKWNNLEWQASVKNSKSQRMAYRYFDNDKDAAKWVDLQLIKQGKDPVNILKKLNE